jgi:FkbM family methyltransferase
MLLSRYAVKRSLLSPRVAYLRRKTRHADPVARHILETQYYRPTIYAFMRATTANPTILVEADLDATSIVLDIGAYIGEWSEQISHRYRCTIYAFEPNPNAFEKLQTRLATHGRVQLFNYGLAGADAQASLALDGPGSSVFAHDSTFGKVDVRLRDVVAVLDSCGIDHVDLCKVNIEGGEYDLFDRLIESDWISRMSSLSIQFHEWHPNAYRRRRAIRRALHRTHTEAWSYPFVWEFWQTRNAAR